MKKILIPILSVFAIALCFYFGVDASVVMATGLVTLAGVPMLNNKEQIESLAENFSNFDDDDYFDNSRMPLTKGVFVFNIRSNSADTQKFYLYSGYLLDSIGFSSSFGALIAGTVGYGQAVDGSFKAIGATSAELSADGDINSINDFLAYVKNIRGNKITKIVIRSATAAVHSQTLVVTKKDPLRQLESRNIRLATWRNPMQVDQNSTTINEVISLGQQDFIQFSIPQGVQDLVIELYLNGYAS